MSKSAISHSNPNPQSPTTSITEIKPQRGWRWIDWHELWEYRDLFYFLSYRQIRSHYAQSALGIGWAVVPPLFQMVIFTIVFGQLAQISSDGIPYALFSIGALVPWNFFTQVLTVTTNSLVQSSSMMSKIYFPRIILPISAALSKLLDLGIALVMLALIMLWFRAIPTIWIITLPLLILIILLTASGAGMWLTALAVQYRDIKLAQNFLTGSLIYISPVIYPVNLIPEQYRLLYALNPMVGVIEGFRAALFGTKPMPWELLSIGAVAAVLLFLTGAAYFLRTERVFADVA